MSEMPTGAVTFLFSDIEGSTRLVKQLRDRYPEVLHEHQRLLRHAFEAHRGYEVDTQGDSFFVAFASARDALLAAVEGQLALSSHPWPEDVAIKVRMGLHTGQAVAAGSRYTGLAVHRAARIGAAAHGGQILVSQATQTLLEDEEEDLHIFLRDLGEQRLKDLERPVRLYQAAADGLPASFPPLRASAELAQAAEVALHPVPLWRRPLVLGAAVVAVIVVVALAVLATRDSGGGLGGVEANQVGLVDPKTNHIIGEVPVGIRPGPLAVGGGSVWVGNLQDRNLTRIDAARRSSAGTVSLDNRTPTGVAVGAGGVWVAHGPRGQVSLVDPQFGQVAKTIDALPALGNQTQLGTVAVGLGAAWAVYGESTLVRIDPRTGGVRGRGLAGVLPAGIAVGAGSVWVANSGDATVYRFNPLTFDEGPIKIVSVGSRPTGIAFGEGALWVTDGGDDAVTRIEPATYASATIAVCDEPVAVTTSSGAVWVACTSGDVVRIDPETHDVAARIHIGNAPAGIAFGEGLVWVATQAP
jgi:class 3 adenylate cyclase/streptogramin lyase